MEAEGNVQTPAKAGGKLKPEYLIAILILILIIIVGLVIWIVFGRSNNNEQGEEEVACEKLTNDREIMSCLNSEEESEDLDQKYDATLEKAFEEERYELFGNVIMDRTSSLVLEDKCDKTLDWLDSLESKYANELPVLDLYGFYVSGQQAAMECSNSDKLTYYRNKIETILASEEYKYAITQDDYRVYGIDIFEDGEEGENREGGDNEE